MPVDCRSWSELRTCPPTLLLAVTLLLVVLPGAACGADPAPAGERAVAGDAVAEAGGAIQEDIPREALPQDVAQLRFGGTLPGQIEPYENATNRGRLIRVASGLIVALPEVEFRRIREDGERLAEYRRRAAATEDTAATHWEMSRWCNGERMYAQKERHLQRVIELDPNHGPARQELGYELRDNGWVQSATLRRQRGMLREGGQWRFAEEVMLAHELKDEEQARKDWLKTLAGLKTQVSRGGRRAVDAANQIRMIDDPLADEAVAKEFSSSKDTGPFPRTLWLEILSRLKDDRGERTPIAINTMVKAGLEDPSATVREMCFEALRETGKYQAISYYVRKLRDENNTVVRRAGRALIELNDPEIATHLVEALVTKHRVVVGNPGNQTNVAMSPDGQGGGFSAGGKPTVKEVPVKNPEVLTALLEVVPEDVNFQYDEDRWRQYFALRLAPSPGDLRRDP